MLEGMRSLAPLDVALSGLRSCRMRSYPHMHFLFSVIASLSLNRLRTRSLRRPHCKTPQSSPQLLTWGGRTAPQVHIKAERRPRGLCG